MPPPSPELVLWRASVQALLATMGRRKGERFLRIMAEQLAGEDNLSSVFNIRPTSEHARVRVVRRQAAEMFRRYVPVFLAGLARR